MFNALETFILVFLTFKRYGGVYFWSLLITATAILVAALFNLLVFFSLSAPNYGLVSMAVIGWWFYIPGQSIVLWSRLHLVIASRKILRGTLWMIIISTIVFIIPTTVLVLLQASPDAPPADTHAYYIMEVTQVTGIFLQELFIAGLYMWKSIQLSMLVVERQKQIILFQVFAINIAIVVMDLAILIPQYLHQREIQVMIKTLVYSIKLKLELVVLNKMVNFVTIAQTDEGNLTIWETSTFGTCYGRGAGISRPCDYSTQTSGRSML
jgi:hypothetical protein